MTLQPIGKYQTFISYCHKDHRWATWLERKLEQYAFPRELVGRKTVRVVGDQRFERSIERRLGPIFRDRTCLPAGASLTETIKEALLQSESLIVLCSAASACSKHVNDEILFFQQNCSSRPVLPVIIDGSGKFPDALICPGSDICDSIAADVRRGKDGAQLAKLKIIAGINGDLSPKDFFSATAVSEKRKNLVWSGVAAVMSLLLVAAWSLWISSQRNLGLADRRLDAMIGANRTFTRQVIKESDDLGIPAEKTIKFLEVIEKRVNALDDDEGSLETRLDRAQLELNFCDPYMNVGNLAAWEERARRAVTRFELLAKDYPDRLQFQERLGAASYQVGLVLQMKGDLAGSQQWFDRTKKIRIALLNDKLGRAVEGRTQPQLKRDLSAVFLMYGENAREMVGGQPSAIANFMDALREREDLLKAITTNDRIQDVAMAHFYLGETYLTAAELVDAEDHLSLSMQMRESVHRTDAKNIKYKRHYARSLDFMARLRFAQFKSGDLHHLEHAQALNEKALEIMREVVTSDPDNMIFKSDLAWVLGHHGLIARSDAEAIGDLEKATQLLIEVRERFRSELRDGSIWKAERDVAYWRANTAEAYARLGRHDEATALLVEARAAMRRIIAALPVNATWRSELAVIEARASEHHIDPVAENDVIVTHQYASREMTKLGAAAQPDK